MIRYLAISLIFVLAAFPAHAISIANLDKKPHTVVINNMGEVVKKTIAPNAVVQCCYSPYVELEMDGYEQTGEGSYRYAIWPDGQLILQDRHLLTHGKSF